jgi:chromosome segregation ATPase
MVRQHVKTSQSQQKANTALTEKISDQIEGLDFTSAVAALKGFGREINSLTTQIDLLSKVTGQAEVGAAKMTSSIFMATTELDKATNEFSRYRNIGDDYDQAAQSLGDVTEIAGQVTKSLEAVNNVGILSTIADLDAKAVAIDQELAKTDQHIVRLSSSTHEAQNKLGSSLAKLDESTDAVKGVSQKLMDLDGLTQDLLDTNNIIRSLRTEVEEINTQISLEMTKARDEISKTTGMAADLLKLEIIPITDAINKISEDFDPIEKNLHNLDSRVRRSISDVLDFLNK